MMPWEVGENFGDATPVRILGGVYFVGTQPASTHIIDTGSGLILIDSGYRQTLHLVLHHMWQLGLNPLDIKCILCTHGHIDHIGATAALVRLTGAKTFIGRQDRDYANGKLDLTFAREYGMAYDETFEPDVLLNDGDTICLGNTTITCVATPGHTPGCMSYFFDIVEDGKTYRAGLHGGMGVNTMGKAFLDKYGLSYACREDFIKAMDRLAEEKVDVFLGNHMQNNNTAEKTKKVLAGDKYAFVVPGEWLNCVTWAKKNLMNMIKEEEQQYAGK